MSPTFLTLDEVLEIHCDQRTRYGGSHGIRDLGLLQSALAQPQATFGGQFLHPDLFQVAATLEQMVLSVAEGKTDKAAIAEFFAKHASAVES